MSTSSDGRGSLARAFHDVRTPLTVLQGRAHQTRRRLQRTPAPKQAELLSLLGEIDRHIITLCRDLDSLERLDDAGRL